MLVAIQQRNAVSFTFDTPSFWIVISSVAALHIWMLQIASTPEALRWGRYVRLPAVIVWLLYGFTVSLVVVLAATFLAMLLLVYRDPNKRLLHNSAILSWIPVIGVSIFAAHISLLLFGGMLPISVMDVRIYWVVLFVSIVIADIALLLTTLWLTDVTWADQRAYLRQHIIFDFFIDILSITLPLILEEVNLVAFGVILVLVAAQSIQQYRLSNTQSNLLKRLQNMSAINQLGRAVSSHIDLQNVTDTIYAELTQLIQASTYYIALYDNDEDLISYPLVYHQDRKLNWTSHASYDGLTEQILESRSTIILENSAKRREQLGEQFASLSDTVFMGTPLMVSDKLIGVLGVGRSGDGVFFDETDIEILQTVASQASLALRNASLYERTSSLAKNLADINHSLQDVMFNLDRDDALRSACEIAMKVTQAQQVAIYLLDTNADNLMTRVQMVGNDFTTIPITLRYRPALFDTGSRIIKRKLTPDDTQDRRELSAYHNVLQIPLRSGNTMIGLMGIYHVDTYEIDDPELDLLQMLSNQITAALDNADLLQALELYATEQAQLVHLSRISSSNLDLERIIQDVCMMLSQIMQMDVIQIILRDSDEDFLQVFRLDDTQKILTMTIISIHELPEVSSTIFSDTTNTISTYYADQSTLSETFSDYMQLIGASMAALAPLHINQHTIGVLLMADSHERRLNDNEFRLIEMAAHQISAQIHNARIHMLTEEALVQRLEQLSLIEEISQQISQALDYEVIIDNVLDAAMQATQAHLVSLSLISMTHANQVNVIWKVHEHGVVERRTTQTDIVGIVGYVFNTGETLVISENEQFDDYYAPPIDVEYRSSLAVPLIKGDIIIGVLNLESTQSNFFTNEQASFIRSLAGHAAISIDNARLLEERERQINTLTRLRSLSLETLSLTHYRRIANAILRTALIILDGHESALFTRHHELEAYTLLAGSTLRDSIVEDSTPAIPIALIDEAVNEGRALTISNVADHPAYQKAQVTYKHQSIVVIPIQRRQSTYEVLCVTFDTPRIFSTQDINTIDLLAVQAAGHLENAALTIMIQTSNKRMRAILDSTRDGIVLLDERAYIQDVNSAAERLLRLPISSAMHESFTRFVNEHPNADPVLRDMSVHYAYEPNSINDKEYRIGDGDEATFIKTLVITVRDSEESISGHLLILRDITEEKSLETFQEQLQQMVLHDLRSPLASIVSSMYLSLNVIEFPGEKPIEDTLVQTLQVSLDSATYLMSLVDTMRELPKLAEMSFETQPNRVHPIAEKAEKTLKTVLEEADIRVEYDIPDDLPPIDVAPEYIQRVFQNLMHNAYKFTPSGGTILISAKLQEDDEQFVRLQVSDTGPGIPESQRERIFGQFIQIEGIIPRKGGKGSGLGLNFCKLTVEGHGGTIWVAPDGPLSGATFAFTLPIYDGEFIEHEEPPVLDFDD